MVRERVRPQQPQHVGRPLEQPRLERGEPRDVLVARQRGEPHLPVEARLVRLDEPRTAHGVPGLPAEFVRPPRLRIVAAFDHDLRPLRRHHAEQAVGIDAAEGFQPHHRPDQEPRRVAPRECCAPELDGREQEGHQPHDRHRGRDRQGEGAHTPRDRLHDAPREHTGPPGVVHEQQRQGDGQQIEKVVVAGPQDRQLEEDQPRRRNEPHRARTEDQQRESDLEHVGRQHHPFLAPGRQQVHVPGRPRRQWLGPEVVVQGGEVAPRRIPAVELHDPRLEREPEQQPPQEQQREGRQRAPRGGEDREKPGLEQQHVPLEGHERPADRREREVERPTEDEVDGRPDVEQDQHSGDDSRETAHDERRAVGAEPEQRRHQPEALHAMVLAHRLEELLSRQDAVRTDQPLDLDPERSERDEIDEGEGAQEHPLREHIRRAARRHAHHPTGGALHGVQDRADPLG